MLAEEVLGEFVSNVIVLLASLLRVGVTEGTPCHIRASIDLSTHTFIASLHHQWSLLTKIYVGAIFA